MEQGALIVRGAEELAPCRDAWNRLPLARGAQADIYDDDSSARIYFGPAVGAGARVVRLIGGPNAGGTYNAGWQQDHDPFADEQEPSDHYDTYSPGATSYEFWIDGRNYPPADTDCRVGDVAYSARNEPTVGRKASPAGDWRIEYQAVAASTPVILTTLIHVTARNSPEENPGITYESADSMSIRLRLPLDAGGDRELILGPPGGTHARGAGQFRGGP